MAFKPFGVAIGKVWGFPIKLTSSHDEALDIAGELLSESAGAATV